MTGERMLSPSRRPFESGAARWQQRSANATTFPEVLRQNNSGTCVMIRGSMPSSGTSYDHAATYQVFLRKLAVISGSRASKTGIYVYGMDYAKKDFRAAG